MFVTEWSSPQATVESAVLKQRSANCERLPSTVPCGLDLGLEANKFGGCPLV